MYVQQQIQPPSQENLKLHQQHFPQQQAMPQRVFLQVLSVFASLSNHFFKASSCFGRETLVSPPPSKSPMTERAIVAIPAKRAESVEIIVKICYRIKIQILFDKGVFLSRNFSSVCLIPATCV